MTDRIPVSEIETPALLIDMDALEYNIRIMSEYIKRTRAELRPHFMTYKCPRITYMQQGAGAKGATCATVGEAEALAAAGIGDILIANQIVEQSKLLRVAELAKNGARISILTDNAVNVWDIAAAAITFRTEIRVLVELDVGMGRCGVASPEAALDLAEQIGKTPGLVFDGIQAYEGHLSHIPDEAARRAGVRLMTEKVRETVRLLRANGVDVNTVSGAGTGTYNITAEEGLWTEIQAGSYVFMDAGYGKLGLGFRQSLTVLATVIHKRPGFAVTDAGTKACGVDQGPPVIKRHPEIAVVLNEEHGKLADAGNKLRYRQKVEYVPGHCFTTVNLYDAYYCVRDGVLEDIWPIVGRYKSMR